MDANEIISRVLELMETSAQVQCLGPGIPGPLKDKYDLLHKDLEAQLASRPGISRAKVAAIADAMEKFDAPMVPKWVFAVGDWMRELRDLLGDTPAATPAEPEFVTCPKCGCDVFEGGAASAVCAGCGEYHMPKEASDAK